MSDADRPGSLSSRLHAHSSAAMVVEDEPDIAVFMGAFFRASGLDLVHLDPTTPEEVVQRAIADRVGCVLLDLRLRETTGFEVLEALRAEPRLAGLPVMIVSANDSKDARLRVDTLGATDFIAKPFQVKDLFARTAELLVPILATPLDQDALRSRLARLIRQAVRADRAATFALLRLRLDGVVPPAYQLDGAATRLRDALGEDAVLGSSGPDELALFLDGDQATVAAQLRRAIAGGARPLTACAGFASYPDHASDADGLYMAADAALAEAAETGAEVVAAR